MLNDRRRLGHYGLELLLVALLAGLSHIGYAGADIAPTEMPLEAAGEWADPFHGGMRGELLDALLDPSNAALEEARLPHCNHEEGAWRARPADLRKGPSASPQNGLTLRPCPENIWFNVWSRFDDVGLYLMWHGFRDELAGHCHGH